MKCDCIWKIILKKYAITIVSSVYNQIVTQPDSIWLSNQDENAVPNSKAYNNYNNSSSSKILT